MVQRTIVLAIFVIRMRKVLPSLIQRTMVFPTIAMRMMREKKKVQMT